MSLHILSKKQVFPQAVSPSSHRKRRPHYWPLVGPFPPVRFKSWVTGAPPPEEPESHFHLSLECCLSSASTCPLGSGTVLLGHWLLRPLSQDDVPLTCVMFGARG